MNMRKSRPRASESSYRVKHLHVQSNSFVIYYYNVAWRLIVANGWLRVWVLLNGSAIMQAVQFGFLDQRRPRTSLY